MTLIAPEPIHTPRLIVRPVAEPDLPALLAVNGDDEVTRFLPYDRWRSMADADAWYARIAGIQASGLAVQFVVVEALSGTAIGSCLLFRYEASSARAELGYVLGRAHWGRGYMLEALTALIDQAFGGLSLRRLEAEVAPANLASRRLLGTLGFTREGLLRQRWVSKGEARDVEAHELLRHEWPRTALGAGAGSTSASAPES